MAASARGCARPWSGSGTASDPYLIANQTDLNNVRACTYSDDLMVFKQTADITLVGNWSPILGQGAFYGTYDGGGHTINGLSISVNASNIGTGLFAVIVGGTVKNLTIANATVTTTGYSNFVGVLAGVLRGAGTISDVHITGASTVSGIAYVGGLIGAVQTQSQPATISRTSSTAVVTGGEYSGGLVGVTENAAINDSYARGAVTGTYYVGGLIGTAVNSTLVRDYATGRVTATNSGGGLVGSDVGPASTTTTASYWDTSTTGQSTSLFGTGASTAQMTTIGTFSAAGWGIVSGWQAATSATPWGICSTVNDGYPFLLAEYATSPCPAAPAAPAATVVAPTCASTGWSFGILDVSKSGYGDRLQVSWKTPKTCDGSGITGYTLSQASSNTGAEAAVDLSKCTPSGANSTGWGNEASGAGVLHTCSFPVKGPDERWFRLKATTASGKTTEARRIAWIKSDVPNADVQDLGGGNCSVGANSQLVCFIINLVIQTEFASNGNQALTDKQMVELLNIGVEYSDVQTARSSRAVRWISAGQASRRVRKSGPVAVTVPLNSRATARLRNGSLRVRYTISIKRGSVTKRIVKFATLPKLAAPSGAPSVTG